MNNWYVYRHIRRDKNSPFYIGIGCKRDYFRAYESGAKRNNIWNKITSKSQWDVEILFDGITKQEASLKEQEFIDLYGRIDNNTGCLANMTNGGDGIWGCVRSKETRAKLSTSKIGDKNPMYNKKPSTETLKKMSISQKKFWLTKDDEYRNKHGDATREKILLKQGKPVLVYNYNTGEFIREFDSMRRAAKILGVEDNKITSICKGKRNRTGNYTFVYKTTDSIPEKIVINKQRPKKSQSYKDLMSNKMSIPVVQLDNNLVVIKEWRSATDAARVIKTQACHIGAVCKGKRPKAGGYIWRYKSDLKSEIC